MATVGQLIAKLILDKTNFSTGLKTAGKETNTFKEMGQKAFNALKTVAVVAFGAITTATTKAIVDAVKYEKVLANVSTMVTSNVQPTMEIFNKALLEQSKLLGEDVQALGKGLYDILSAGITDTSDAMHVLEVSSKAAKAGLTDTGVAADVLTTVINAYGLEADQAMTVSDLLFKIVQRGKTTFGELAPAIGRVATISAQAGVSMEEMGAMLAVMTRNGVRTDEAVTALRGVITRFLKPTEELTEAFGENALQSKGLANVLDEMAGMSPDIIAKFFPDVRGMLGAITAAQDMSSETQEFIDTLKNGSPTMDAFDKQTNTFDFTWNQFLQTIKTTGIEVGKKFLPILRDALKNVMKWIDENHESIMGFADGMANLVKFIINVVQNIFKFIEALGPLPVVIGGVAAALALLNANPVFALVTAVVALTAAVGGLIKEHERQKNINRILADQTKTKIEQFTTLRDRYEELTSKTTLSKEENEELKNVIQDLIDINPDLVAGVNDYGDALLLNISTLDASIVKMKEEEYEHRIAHIKKMKRELEKAKINSQSGFIINKNQKKIEELEKKINEEIEIATQLRVELDKESTSFYSNLFNNQSNLLDELQKEREERKKAREVAKEAAKEDKELTEEQIQLREEFRLMQLSLMEQELEDIETRKKAYLEAGINRREVETWAQEEIEKIQEKYKEKVEETQAFVKDVFEETQESIIESEKEKYDELNTMNQEYVESSLNNLEIIKQGNEDVLKVIYETWKKTYDKIKNIITTTVDFIGGVFDAYWDMQESNIDANVEDEKKAERKKAQIARNRFVFQKLETLIQTGISTAQAIMKTYETLGYPWGIPAAIAVGAIGAAKAIFIAAKKPPPLPTYQHGGWVEGIPGIDKNTIRASRGEFVVNEEAAAKNRGLLENINAGGAGMPNITIMPGTINVVLSDGRIIGTADLKFIQYQSKHGGVAIHPRAISEAV